MTTILYSIIAIGGIAVGYMLRKYVEKRWPDQARALDVSAKSLADRVEESAK